MRLTDRLGIATNVAVMLLVAYALGRPHGPIGGVVSNRWRQYESRQVLHHEWARVSDGVRLDSAGGPPLVVEFSDYECPFCRQQHQTLLSAIEKGIVRGVVFRHLPLIIHKRARGAALAAICAEERGKFRELHERLFSDTAWLADTNWVREAVVVGIVDTVAFARCIQGNAARQRLERDVKMARELGVRGTPSFLSRLQVIEGVIAESTMVRLAAGR